MSRPRHADAERTRRRVLTLRARGRTLVAIAALVHRTRRRVLQILADERKRFEAEHERDCG